MSNRVRARRNPTRRQPEVTLKHGTGERGSHTGTGKQKRNPVSNELQAAKKRARGQKMSVNIPEGMTGTGEQAS
jgi:hypothetical protein